MKVPTDREALDAFKAVQSLPAADLDQRITDEIGDAMLGVFASIARSAAPKDTEDEIARKVHLMVLAYLMRGVLQRTAP